MIKILQFTGKRSASCQCSVCGGVYETIDRFTASKVHAGDQCDTCKNLPKNKPTQQLLHEVFDYDPATGALTYKRDFSRRHAGTVATTEASNGYLVVTLDKTYLAHRIIWMRQTGNMPNYIDHQNHVRNDNRWSNLFEVTRLDNDKNKSVNKNNSTGYLGVSFMKSKGKYRATINVDRKQIHLGLFDTAELAHQARIAANSSYGYHSNHGT